MSLKTLSFCLMLLLCTACHKNDSRQYNVSKQHTLLVYMIGDNNLYRYVERNLRDMRLGLLQSDVPINLVIYRDSKATGNSLPQLYQLKRYANSSYTDTIYIKKWSEDVDSTDPNVIAEVLRLTFDKFDTPIKGVEIWSHALSWIPSKGFQAEPLTRALQSVGDDEGRQADLWDFAHGIEKSGVHLDYMLFDACHMATAEVLYELRNQTDYILAAATETVGEGFPYKAMIKSLSTIHDKQTLLSGLEAVYYDYQTTYNRCGTFSLLSTAGADHLLQACQTLEQQASSTLQQWEQQPEVYQQDIQQYGRWLDDNNDNRYLFYDLKNWSDALVSQSDLSNDGGVQSALAECVLQHYNSEECNFQDRREILYIKQSCGLAVSVPQFWRLSNIKNLDKAYSHLQWQMSSDIK